MTIRDGSSKRVHYILILVGPSQGVVEIMLFFVLLLSMLLLFFVSGQSLTCDGLHIHERAWIGLQYHLWFVLFMTDVVSV